MSETKVGEVRQTHHGHRLFGNDSVTELHRGVGPSGSLSQVPTSLPVCHPGDVSLIPVVRVGKVFEAWDNQLRPTSKDMAEKIEGRLQAKQDSP